MSSAETTFNAITLNPIGESRTSTPSTIINVPEEDKMTRTHAPITLEFDSLTFGTAGKEILRGVTGRAEPGQVVAIMGPSGAGTRLFFLFKFLNACVIVNIYSIVV